MNFESELKKGSFQISECLDCKKVVWPPSEFCDNCFKKNSWRKCKGKGIIIEFSKNEDSYFCVAEFENSIKIIGEIISGKPKIGKKVTLVKCGVTNNHYFFKMKLIE